MKNVAMLLISFWGLAGQVAFASGLQGRWSTGCLSQMDHSKKNELKFDGNRMDTSMAQFNDEDCQRVNLKVTVQATFVIPESTDSTKAIDYMIEAIQITTADPNLILVFNKQNFCGFGDWEASVPKDVTGVNCGDAAVWPAKGGMIYDIFALSDDNRKLLTGKQGDGRDGRSLATWPNELNESSVYLRE